MTEIAPRGGKGHQSIAPDTTAPSAPTITAPGAPSIAPPVPASHHRRQTEVQKKFDQIEQEFGGSKYLKHRRDDMKIRASPATPVTDAYTITIRPKDGKAPGLVSLDDLVIQREQRETEEWLRGEEYRATILPGRLQAERSFLAQQDYINRMSAEYDRARAEYDQALAEQAARDTEAQKYGYDTHEELMAAIQEEKAIKRANELGLALEEAYQISLTVGREGYGGATELYGRDPNELIAEQAARAAAAQASLDKNFGIEIDPAHQQYFKDATDLNTQVAALPGKGPGIDDRLNIVSARSPFTTSDLTTPPGDITQGVTRLTKDATGTGWIVEPSTSPFSPFPAPDDRSEIERTLSTHPVLLSPLGTFIQDVLRDRGEVSRAESDYDEAYRQYEERWKAAEDAGLLVDGEFTVSDMASQLQYEELRIAAESTEQFGKRAEELRKSELFGIPAGFQEKETELSSFLNLPALSEDQARAIADSPIFGMPGSPAVISEFRAGVLHGAYGGIRDRPLTGIASFGIGLVGGAALKGISAFPRATKAATISLKGAEAAWVGSIGARTGLAGFTDGAFSMGSAFGGILTTEAVPVAAGAAVAPRLTSAIPRSRPSLEKMKLWAENVPEPLDITAGRLPSEAMIEEGLPLLRAQRRGDIPFTTARSISPRLKRGVITEIEPGVYVSTVLKDQAIRLLKTGSPALDPNYHDIYPFDYAGIPHSHLRAEMRLPESVSIDEGFGGGWRPSEEMIEEGLPLLRAQRRGDIPFTAARSISPRLKRGVITEIEPGVYVSTVLKDQAIRLLKTGSKALPQTRPDDLIYPWEIDAAPKTIGGGPRQSTDPRHSIPVQAFYAGLPITRAPSPLRIRSPHTSLSSQAPRIRPSIGSIRPEIGVIPRRTQIMGVVSDARRDVLSVPMPKMMMDMHLAGEAKRLERLEFARGLENDAMEIVKLDESLGTAHAQDTAFKLRTKQVLTTVPRIGQISITRTRSPDPIRRPKIRIERPPPPPRLLFPDGPDSTRGRGDEFYIHYADRPTPHARLEEAYTDLTGPKIRPAKMITNLERVIVGTPPKATRRKTTTTTTGRKVKRKTPLAPWDITLPAAPSSRKASKFTDPLNLFGTTPKRKKKSRRRR